jgi:hypothetical protein
MALADVLTITVICTTVFIALRRIGLPEVRIVTTLYDYLLLLITVTPFVSGFLVVHQFGDYDFWLYTHILSGELLLRHSVHQALPYCGLLPLPRPLAPTSALSGPTRPGGGLPGKLWYNYK